jgi:hypothetical protein
LVFFRIENDNGDVEEDEYYPSRILGYVTVNSEVHIRGCHMDHVVHS